MKDYRSRGLYLKRMNEYRLQTLYQSNCELIKFNHPLVAGEVALKIVPHIMTVPQSTERYFMALDGCHLPYRDISILKLPSVQSKDSSDSEPKICMAYYDSILITKYHPQSVIVVFEGQMKKVANEDIKMTLSRTILMWENMINVMNGVNPLCVVGDMLQLQCYSSDNKVTFYGMWLLYPGKELKCDLGSICSSYGIHKIKYEYLRHDRSSGGNYMSLVFQSLAGAYNSKQYDQKRTLSILHQASIPVIDSDRCLVRCCIPTKI